MLEHLTTFLQEDLNLTAEQMHLAVSRIQATPSELPILLWQYGLVDLGQLDQIFDWLERTMM